MTDIKELAPELAHRTCNRYKYGDEWFYQFTEQGIIDFATRFLAAYTAEQEPVAIYEADTNHRQFLQTGEMAKGWRWMRKDFARGDKLFTVPPLPEPAPQQEDKTLSRVCRESSAVSAGPSSEEVREMVENLRSPIQDGACHRDAADMLEHLAARVPDGQQNAELVAALEKAAAHVRPTCTDLYDELETALSKVKQP